MAPENIPANASRITFTCWTTAPYTEAEKKTLLNDFISFANEGDDDTIPDSYEMKFETQGEIIDAKNMELVKALNDAETTVTLQFGPEAKDLIFVVGEDS